jgi:segregation and condensation protein B
VENSVSMSTAQTNGSELDEHQSGLSAQFRALQLPDAPESEGEQLALLEALLLAAPGPTTIEELAYGFGAETDQVTRLLSMLEQREDRGWVIQRHGDRLQLATAPRFSRYVRRYLGMEREVRLSTAALETLAVIAYQQPVTRSAIEKVRGVDCSGVLSTLLSRGLIDASGRVEGPGQPFQYEVTPAFLRHFGLRSLEDLPPLGGAEGSDLHEKLREAAFSTDEAEPACE